MKMTGNGILRRSAWIQSSNYIRHKPTYVWNTRWGDASLIWGIVARNFSEKMDQNENAGSKNFRLFAEEFKKPGIITYSCLQWAILIAFVWDICCNHFLLPNLGKIGEKPLNKVAWMDIDKLIAMPVKLENDEIVLKETLIFWGSWIWRIFGKLNKKFDDRSPKNWFRERIYCGNTGNTV